MNSAQRVAAVGRRYRLEGEIPTGPVLLVDDQVVTGWTLTLAARAIRAAGATGVLPLVLRRPSAIGQARTMRFGLTILPEIPWAEAGPRWRAAEDIGFDHAWTYDHLVWGGLPESPWFGTTPTLTAAAHGHPHRSGSARSCRRPTSGTRSRYFRDVQSLDDISGGRFLLGVGTGGDLDSRILGGPDLSVKERVDRFQEFVDLLVRLRTEDHVTSRGHLVLGVRRAHAAAAARRTPGRGRQRTPLGALRGPPRRRLGDHRRQGRDARRRGSPGSPTSTRVLDEALTAGSRPGGFAATSTSTRRRVFSLESVGRFEEMTGRAAEIGFTDVITHWPRPDSPYAGDEAVLDSVASDVIPALR